MFKGEGQTLSHFDFLFCRESFAITSTATGSDCNPGATTPEIAPTYISQQMMINQEQVCVKRLKISVQTKTGVYTHENAVCPGIEYNYNITPGICALIFNA